MKCKLLDLQCQALNALLGLPWYVYALAALAVVLLGWVLFDKIKGTALRIIRWGGWRAGLAALLGVVAVVAAFWPRKHVPTDDQYAHPDPKVRRPKGKRVYNPDTNEWE